MPLHHFRFSRPDLLVYFKKTTSALLQDSEFANISPWMCSLNPALPTSLLGHNFAKICMNFVADFGYRQIPSPSSQFFVLSQNLSHFCHRPPSRDTCVQTMTPDVVSLTKQNGNFCPLPGSYIFSQNGGTSLTPLFRHQLYIFPKTFRRTHSDENQPPVSRLSQN